MLGSRISLLRWRAGISQADLADRLHVSPSAVGMYEQGRREPPSSILIALSREFNVTVDYLLTGHICSQKDANAMSDLVMNALGQASSRQNHCVKECLAILIALKLMDQKANWTT